MASGTDNDGMGELLSWIPVVILLVAFWPVGLFLLARKLMGYSSTSRKTEQRPPYDTQRTGGNWQSSGTAGGTTWQSSASGGTTWQRADTPGGQTQRQPEYGTWQNGGTRWEKDAKRSTGPYRPSEQEGPRGTPYGAPAEKKKKAGAKGAVPKAPVDLNKGKSMTHLGAILAAVGGVLSATTIPIMFVEDGVFDALAGGGPLLGLFGAGLVLLFLGMQRTKKSKRFRKYLALIGKRDSIAIATLAQAMPASLRTACEDLQQMLDEGVIPEGYLDMGSGRLILNSEGLKDTPEPTPQPAAEPEPPEDDDAVLNQIRAVNDRIGDEEMSRKIDRIGEITGKIFAYQKQTPGTDSQLRSFLSYYLPTTLKILNAYAQMEAQGIDGENIRAAKSRIEGMMDKVVEGFEKQLDKLFQDDAMDITTDVEVLERMLNKDGLSGSDGMQLGR